MTYEWLTPEVHVALLRAGNPQTLAYSFEEFGLCCYMEGMRKTFLIYAAHLKNCRLNLEPYELVSYPTCTCGLVKVRLR